MSAAVTAPTTQPDPAAADQPSRAWRLLGLVRKLIDYGKQLAASFQQGTLTTDLASATLGFGTRDIALILARITRGLQRADALEAGLVGGTACVDEAPRPAAAQAQRLPRVALPAAEPPTRRAEEPDARLVRLPTAAQIAADVRRRPVGAVIADICRDLGIMPNHPLWPELSELIIRYGGNLGTLYLDTIRRVFPVSTAALAGITRAATPPPLRPSPGPAGTGPP
jgi:hypothetical protein